MHASRSVRYVLACLVLALLAGPGLAQPAPPRNVIIMIADGCGFNHLQAASLFAHGRPDSPLYESFPVRLAMSTFAAGGAYDPAAAAAQFDYVASGATDSAAAATAMACGVKTYRGAIGVDQDKQPVANVIESAEELGRATGVVTSVQFSHATPAGFVAHNESRSNYAEIAAEMIGHSALEVIMGAGHPEFDNNGRQVQGESDYRYVGGEETWSALRAGTVGADADGDGTPDPWTLVESLTEFRALQEGETPNRVIGVARVATTLQQGRAAVHADGAAAETPFAAPPNEGVPTLAEMTRAALKVLDEDPDGLLLMVEGGAIDWAAHGNQCGRMIEEVVDFNAAVGAVINWVEANSNWDETLLIVTADHETGFLNGPGEEEAWCPLQPCEAGALPQVRWHSRSHTNSLVPFFARGAGSERFVERANREDSMRGRYLDNTDIAQVLFELMSRTRPTSGRNEAGARRGSLVTCWAGLSMPVRPSARR